MAISNIGNLGFSYADYTNILTGQQNYNMLKAGYKSAISKGSSYAKNTATTPPETQTYLTDTKSISGELKKAADAMLYGVPPVFQQMTAALDKNESYEVKGVNSTVANVNKTVALDIKQVALAQKNEGESLDANAITENAGTNKFSISSGGKTVDFNINISKTDTNKSAQQKVADAINKSGLGLNATVSYDSKTKQSSLTIESKKTGEANGFEISEQTGNLMASLGVTGVDTAAQDALYTVDNGVERKSATNTVSIGNGITAELKKATEETAKVTLKKDTTKIINGVYDFVNNFNALLDTAKEFGSTGSDKLASQLSGALKSYSSSLSKVGITTDKNGYMKLDESKVKKSIEDGSMEKALGVSKGGSYGFVSKVRQIATSVNSNPSRYVGTSTQAVSANTSLFDSSTGGLTGLGLLFDAFA